MALTLITLRFSVTISFFISALFCVVHLSSWVMDLFHGYTVNALKLAGHDLYFLYYIILPLTLLLTLGLVQKKNVCQLI